VREVWSDRDLNPIPPEPGADVLLLVPSDRFVVKISLKMTV